MNDLRFTKGQLLRMSVDEPYRLLSLVKSADMPPATLTFAAEMLGLTRLPEAKTVLLDLLGCDSDLVREGAVYGLREWREDPEVARAVQSLAGSCSATFAVLMRDLWDNPEEDEVWRDL